jgi:hypothetical protein
MTNRTPAIVGFLIAGALVLGIGFYVGGRERTMGDGVPELTIDWPRSGDTVSNPVAIRFRTEAPLALTERGWTAHDMHLHILAGTLEIMPGATDITREGTVFVWRLSSLPPGDHTIVLTWAGRNHGNLRGVTDTLHLHIVD